MREVREDARFKREVEDAVDEDAEIEIAAAEEEPHHAVEEIEDPKQPEVEHRPAARMPGGDGGPDARGKVEGIIIEVEVEEAEGVTFRVLEGRHIADARDQEKE